MVWFFSPFFFFEPPEPEPMGAQVCGKCEENWPNEVFFREKCPTCWGKTRYDAYAKPLTEREVAARIPQPKSELEAHPDHVKELNADLAKLQAAAVPQGKTWVDLIDFRDPAAGRGVPDPIYFPKEAA